MAQRFIIRSRDRTSQSTSSSDFTITLHDKLIGKWKLSYCIIPDVAYNCNSSNNTIIWNDGGSDLTATITPGNYSASELADAIKTAMNASSGKSVTINTVSYDSNTFKFTISASGVIQMILSSSSMTAGTLIGFQGTSDTSSDADQTSDSVANVQRYLAYNIRIKESESHSYQNIKESNGHYASLFIPLDSGTGGYYISTSLGEFPQYINLTGTRFLSITIYDSGGEVIDLNNGEWLAVFESA